MFHAIPGQVVQRLFRRCWKRRLLMARASCRNERNSSPSSQLARDFWSRSPGAVGHRRLTNCTKLPRDPAVPVKTDSKSRWG
jgi:hypothetical protein